MEKAAATSLETERLRLRPFREDDVEGYFRIASDPEVMRYMGRGQTLSREECWRAIAFYLGHWELRGFGLWAVEERGSSGELIGRIGLFHPDGWPGLEVGWLLARSRWGRGLATEGGRAALEHAFAALGADHVISVIHPDNAASIRVAEKLGEAFERTMDLNGIELAIYGIRR